MTPAELAAGIAGLPASVGGVVLVGIDGFSGAGKTALSESMARHADVASQSIEEFYPGWEGLGAGVGRAGQGLLEPLARQEVRRWRAWDWERGAEGAEREHPVTARVVLLEGCGAGARALRAYQALTIWVHADAATREARLHDREDWADYAPFRARWEQQERELAEREGLPDAADLVVVWAPDGSVDTWMSPHRWGRQRPGWVPSRP